MVIRGKSRGGYKLLVLSMHRNLLHQYLLVVLPGPVGILLYRASLFVQREWNQNRDSVDNSGFKMIRSEFLGRENNEEKKSRKIEQTNICKNCKSRFFGLIGY